MLRCCIENVRQLRMILCKIFVIENEWKKTRLSKIVFDIFLVSIYKIEYEIK